MWIKWFCIRCIIHCEHWTYTEIRVLKDCCNLMFAILWGLSGKIEMISLIKFIVQKSAGPYGSTHVQSTCPSSAGIYLRRTVAERRSAAWGTSWKTKTSSLSQGERTLVAFSMIKSDMCKSHSARRRLLKMQQYSRHLSTCHVYFAKWWLDDLGERGFCIFW